MRLALFSPSLHEHLAEGFTDVSIMAYTAKYASAFYGPFRDALDRYPHPPLHADVHPPSHASLDIPLF